MKLLFDQNISHRILKLLPEWYMSSSTIKKEGLIDSKDYEIWEYAKRNDYVIVTQDSDFNDLTTLYGFPPKIIWIRTGNIRTEQIAEIFINYKADLLDFHKSENFGCFEIIKIEK